MCGIVGLFFKRGTATPDLGPLLAGMLSQMAERGPDSTGFALYGDAAPEGAFKATLHARSGGDATIVAFAPSAENGAPQHEVDVAVTVAP